MTALQALLTLRAEGNLAAGLLAEAAHVDDRGLDPAYSRAVLGGGGDDRKEP